MHVTLRAEALEKINGEAVVAVVFEGDESRDGLAGGLVGELRRTGEIRGKFLELTLLHRPAGLAARRLVLVGGGKADQFSPAELRKGAGAALRLLKEKGVREFCVVPTEGSPAQVAAVVEGVIAGDFEPDAYKTEKNGERRVDRVEVSAAETPENRAALERAAVAAEAQNFARELINEPANRLTPRELVARAQKVAEETGLEFEVLDQDRMRALGMGALLGVAQGSDEPPALIVLRYRPEGGAAPTHLGLVGKAVTFDTGGISIKPADGMEKMKYDMAGGATMIAVLRALSRLKPGVAVTAYVPAVENMPGGRAQRPGDIVKTMAGKTVEVINTDAEGRLILADGIAYAKQQGCTHLVDAATLTGAIVVALGYTNVGVFGNDQRWLDQVLGSARACGEKMWPMPLDDDYKEQLKSIIADLPNVGTRWGGAVTAAMFLKEFADPTPWVHLDIAGTAWIEEAKPYLPKGPTGVAVRTLIDLAMKL
jgi:leucyl aminopeptidase